MGPEELYGYQSQQQVYQQPDPHKRRRLIIGVSGLSLFLLILMIVVAMIFSTPSVQPQITRVTALQSEAGRIAQLAISSTSARQSTKILAANTKVISLGNVSQVSNWVSENLPYSLSKNALASQQNENVDAALIEAGQQNEYDAKFSEIITNVLEATNSEIAQNMDSFNSYPELQTLLLNVKRNNSILLDSVN